jgi:oxygen-independent coproporphyrinogen-3 oxidase
VSFLETQGAQNAYVEALLREIRHFYKGETLGSLYFGGGTPSLLRAESFTKIINSLKLAQDAEITVEINPESTSAEFLNALYNNGVNRLSIGVQSFDDALLRTLGRLHDVNSAKNAVALAKNAGFKNISVDLMYGLPRQSLKNWENTLNEALGLNVEHISLYGLKIEEGSYFYDSPPKALADEDLQADMYLLAIDMLKDFGHYEISNFARSKCESRHNSGYWALTPYYGFGPSAAGYLGGKRYVNAMVLEEYIKNPTQSKKFTETNPLDEEIFLGFRRISGLDIYRINKKYGIDFEAKYACVLEKYSKHILKTEVGYKLSVEGILLSNLVLSEFI